MDVANTSPIMGLATDIKPIPPVANKVDVENNSQNWGVFIHVPTSTFKAEPVEVAGGVQPCGMYPGAGFFMNNADVTTVAP